jgi:hypothetical protein
MDKFIKVGVAVAVAFSLSFAANPLWNKGVKGGQVMFPWIAACWDDPDANELDDEDPCYTELGGWWFGFVSFGDPTNTPGYTTRCPPEVGEDEGAVSNSDVYIKARVGLDLPDNTSNWPSFSGPDYLEDSGHKCKGPPITFIEDGSSMLPGNGLELELKIGGGDGLYEPDIAAVAVNFSTPVGAEKDMTNYNGFCLRYESDHNNTAHDFKFELGWLEKKQGAIIHGYDTWLADIPETGGYGTPKTVDFRWGTGRGLPDEGDDCTYSDQCKKVGDFFKDGWNLLYDEKTDGSKHPEGTLELARTKMTAVKIRLKNSNGTPPPAVKFKIIEFGFAGNCTGSTGQPTPIVSTLVKQNAAKFNLTGRTLSMLSEKASVQIINLQGALVQAKTLAKNETMDLSSLPTGVYMVRIPAIGYSSRIMIK